MTLILDGRKARDFYKAQLVLRVEKLRARGVAPRLAIIQVGDNRESAIYIEQKKKFGAGIGARVDHIQLPESSSQADLAARVSELNSDQAVHGIIVQMPVPAHLDRVALMNLVDPKKDVDGLTDEPLFTPATARGVMALLDFYGIEVRAKKAAVLGRSRLVGRPIAELLRRRGAEVTVCHSKTEDVPAITHTADIIVAAAGKPRLVDASYIGSPATVIVDVGINTIAGEKLEEEVPKRRIVGDVDFDSVSPRVAAISPVPGGVGPMTVLSLFDNLVSAAEHN